MVHNRFGSDVRPTTFRTTAIQSALGVKGGQQPGFADGPLQPVVIAADFSRSQAPEAVEARALVSFELQAPSSTSVPTFMFFSLAEGGCVIEGLDLAVTVVGTLDTAFPTISDNVTPGTWFVQRMILAGLPRDGIMGPDDVALPRQPGQTQLDAIESGPGTPIFQIEQERMEIGGLEAVSKVLRPNGGIAFPNRIGPDFTFLDPFDWVNDPADPGSTVPTMVLPPIASLKTDVRWFVPKGTGLFFAQTSYGSDFRGCVSLLWREVPQALGLP